MFSGVGIEGVQITVFRFRRILFFFRAVIAGLDPNRPCGRFPSNYWIYILSEDMSNANTPLHYYRQLVIDAFRGNRYQLTERKNAITNEKRTTCRMILSIADEFIHSFHVNRCLHPLTELHFILFCNSSSSSFFCCSDWLDNDFLFSARIFFWPSFSFCSPISEQLVL